MPGTYCDVVVVDRLVQIDGAKTLQMMFHGGLPYAIDKSINVGDVVAVFTPDSQISEEFANANDLIQRHDEETGLRAGGFFAKNRKVRSISLMKGKIRSVGYVATQKEFDYLGVDLRSLVGKSFNNIDGNEICRKYVVPTNNRVSVNAYDRRRERRAYHPMTVGIPEHYDTKQFYRFAKDLQEGDLITITLKLDGTSVRVSNAYEIKQQFTWGERFFNWFVPIKAVTNKMKVGTRRVVLKDSTETYYGNKSIYTDVGKMLDGMLHPGEAVYGEIVGWQNEEKPLFVRGGMKFLYGTKSGERDFYVYNIKWTLLDGSEIDLPWNKIKQRCVELGVKHVPEMPNDFDPGKFDWNSKYWGSHFVYEGNLEKLERTVYDLVDGHDLIDPSHIREGVVLRVESVDGTTKFYKAKSEEFYALEDKSKNAGEVDMEESQEIAEEILL